MFGTNKENKKETRARPEAERRDVRVETLTFVGPGVEIEGSVIASAPLRIDGTIRGEIEAKGEVSVGESGCVEGQVRSESILIAGEVNGDVAVTKQLRLLPSGRLIGDAETPNLVIEEGALFKGECEMTGAEAEAGARAQAARSEAAATSDTESAAAKAPASSAGASQTGGGSGGTATTNPDSAHGKGSDAAGTSGSASHTTAGSDSDSAKSTGEGRQAKKSSMA